MKKIFSAVMVAFTLLLAWGCCEDEPIVIPPVVEPVNPTIEGIVVTNDQKPLVGAVVTITGPESYTLKTDAEGRYSTAIKAGKYSIKASYGDLTPKSGSFTAEDDMALVWNAFLPTPIRIVMPVVKEGKTINIDVPSINSGSSGQKIMTFVFPVDGIEEDDNLVVIYYFDAEFVDDKEGQETRLMTLVKIQYYLESGRQLVKPVTIYVPVPALPAQSLLNGHDQTCELDGDRIKFSTMELGMMILNYYVTIKESTSWEPEYFYPKEYDNRYGSDQMKVSNPPYCRTVGGSISANNMLINNFAQSYTGVFTPAQRLTFNYNYEITLPVGTMATFTAKQQFKLTTFSVANDLLNARVNDAGAVKIYVYLQNRQHIGGSN